MLSVDAITLIAAAVIIIRIRCHALMSAMLSVAAGGAPYALSAL